MKLPASTYRLQLRNGVDFDAAAGWLPHLVNLGITHLYLSPPFTAAPGSTHGYDVTRPDEIDPTLGGRAGFERLSDAARAAGIGIILDLVPNHTAFCLDNPWLVDVLRRGRDSRYARHFDIDWDEGPLALPWLDQPFEALVEQGRVAREGDMLKIGDLAIPMAPGTPGDDPAALHDAQAWRAVHWERERDGVTHRRFFNITGLIGMRVEDPAVFRDMHALTIDLVDQGRVQGLRLDHIDGLADPAGYLRQLRAAVGDVPIWVEKILTGDETLPADWPIEGTTGYEAATMIARTLSGPPAATDRLRAAWVERTGGTDTFHATLIDAKGEVIRRDLAAELRRLISLARAAADPAAGIDPGDEALREAFIALLTQFPRYRSYFTPDHAPGADRALLERVADAAAEGLRSRDTLDWIAGMIAAPEGAAAIALSTRFQQVTGALLAKAHEDTAGFRWTPYLVACEVGADPDVPTADAAALTGWANAQTGTALVLTSSHDTKRSEDSRARLIAWTRAPDDALALIDAAAALPAARDVPGDVLWYMVQAALAIWDAEDGGTDRPGWPDLETRLADHATKALREADRITSWTHPDAGAEARVQDFVAALIAAWRADAPAELGRLIALGDDLALAQLALKLALPGIPDIYRGCEGMFLALTDPDNRHPVDPAALDRLFEAEGTAGDKARLTRRLLHLRRDRPDLFAGALQAEATNDGGLVIRRDGGLCLTLGPGSGVPVDLALPGGGGGDGSGEDQG